MKIDVEEIKKVNLNVGDVLVIRYNLNRTPVYNKNFIKQFKEMFPDNEILFMPDHMEIDKVICTKDVNKIRGIRGQING
jgi:hypothetical protein